MAQNNVVITKYPNGYEMKINGFPVMVDFTSTDKDSVIAEAQAYLAIDATTANGYLSSVINTDDLLITYINDGTPLDFSTDADRVNIHYENHS